MDSEDLLGNDGRKALNACVKVRTCEVAQLKEYNLQTALDGGPLPRKYEEIIKLATVYYGTGFLIGNGFTVTNEHVVRKHLYNEEEYWLLISNEVIHGWSSSISFNGADDLAILYCPELNLKDAEIDSLNLCGVDLLIGQSVFCFGYPPTHKGETALFVEGKVTGKKKVLHEEPLVTLNCSLRVGCSGGPVMRRIKGQIEVLGVVKEIHKKIIFEESERNFMQKMNMLANNTFVQKILQLITPLIKLVFKLRRALTSTHSPFYFFNVIPAQKVKKLLQKAEVRVARVPAM